MDKEHTCHVCKWVPQSSPGQGRVPRGSHTATLSLTLSSRVGLGWPSPHPALAQCSGSPWHRGRSGKNWREKTLRLEQRQSNHPPVTVTGKTRSPGRAWVHFLPINFNYLFSFLSPQVTLSPQVSPFLSHAHMPLLHSLYFSWKAKKKISAVSQWYQFFCVTVGVFCSPTCSLTGMGEVSSSKAVLKIKRQITHIFIDSS